MLDLSSLGHHAEALREGYVVDAHIAWWHVQFRREALVISVSGQLDASNASRFTQELRRLALFPDSVIVDLLAVEFMGVDAMRALFYFHDHRRQASLPWVLVTASWVRRLVQIGDRTDEMPRTTTIGRAFEQIHATAEV